MVAGGTLRLQFAVRVFYVQVGGLGASVNANRLVRSCLGQTAVTAVIRVLRKTFGTGVNRLAGSIETLEIRIRRLQDSSD